MQVKKAMIQSLWCRVANARQSIDFADYRVAYNGENWPQQQHHLNTLYRQLESIERDLAEMVGDFDVPDSLADSVRQVVGAYAKATPVKSAYIHGKTRIASEHAVFLADELDNEPTIADSIKAALQEARS